MIYPLITALYDIYISLICKAFQIILKISQILSQRNWKSVDPQIIPPIHNSVLLKSATEIAEKIRNRSLSSTDVVSTFIQRIEETNPILNFLVDKRFEAALEDAKNVDTYLATTKDDIRDIKEQKPLLGVPVTVKGSFAVKGMLHSVGMHSRKDLVAEEDSDVVKDLKAAGAIVLCVTNTPEGCTSWETYNKLTGRTNNPYNTNRSAGGSSGGEGAALGAAASAIGFGSDLFGSIRIPAAFNGVFGHRTSSAFVSGKGHVPRLSLLTVGPMTRYAKDLKVIVKATTKTIDLNLDTPVDFKKLKVFYLKEGSESFMSSSVQPAIQEAVLRAAHHFRKLGAEVKSITLPKMKYAAHYVAAKMISNEEPEVRRELADNNKKMSIFAEILKCALGTSKFDLSPLLTIFLEEHYPMPSMLKRQFQNDSDELKNQLQNLLGNNGIFIHPTYPTTAGKHGEHWWKFFDAAYSSIFNVFDFPATQCPMGLDNNHMPVGIQVVANNKQDRLTLAVAEELEAAFGGWVPPYETKIK